MNTSYYGSRLWGNSNSVAISQGVPKWYKGRVYKKLAPTWQMVRIQDEEEYTRQYKKHILDRLDPRQVYQELGANAVLLCYEKPNEFCHRQIVAKWLEEELGIEVTELQRPTQPIQPKTETKKKKETRAEIRRRMELEVLTKNQISLF